MFVFHTCRASLVSRETQQFVLNIPLWCIDANPATAAMHLCLDLPQSRHLQQMNNLLLLVQELFQVCGDLKRFGVQYNPE